MTALLRQTQIYVDGISGQRPKVPPDAGRLGEITREALVEAPGGLPLR